MKKEHWYYVENNRTGRKTLIQRAAVNFPAIFILIKYTDYIEME